jgi:hypothetical protein
MVLKNYVKTALERHNRSVAIRKPCVTAQYMKDGEPELHVDLPIYTEDLMKLTYLARGKDSSSAEWQPSDAEGLHSQILDKFDGDDKKQWRRVVRAIKRWRDEKIGHKNIPSIGLTVAAWKWFNPVYNPIDGKPRDLIAIYNLVVSILSNWSGSRLLLLSPANPFNDLFKKPSDTQMSDFKEKLESLRDALDEANKQPDTHEACKILQKKFGSDFPVPDKTDTTKNTQPTFQSTGRSA